MKYLLVEAYVPAGVKKAPRAKTFDRQIQFESIMISFFLKEEKYYLYFVRLF
jgi:hypothetical protein